MKNVRVVNPVDMRGLRTILVLALSVGAFTVDGHAGDRRYTVDDLLRTETVGRVVIAPDDRRVVFEHAGAWQSLSDFGVAGAPWDRERGSQLYVVEPHLSETPRSLLSEAAVGAHWIDALSPDGRKLAIGWIQDAVQKAGVYDFETQRLLELPVVPNLNSFQTRPAWISEDELVYSTMTAERLSATYFPRIAIANRLSKWWRLARTGKEPSVSVLHSREDGNAQAPLRQDGSLVKINVRSGEVTELARGFFANLLVSPNKRFLAAVRMGEYIQLLPSTNMTGFEQRAQLAVYDLDNDSQETIVCTGCNVGMGTIEWSSDSNTLTFFARLGDESWDKGRFYRHAASTGETRRIDHVGLDLASQRERGFFHRPERAAWAGGRLAVFARRAEGGDATPTFVRKGFYGSRRGRADWFFVDEAGEAANATPEFGSVSPVLISALDDGIVVLADGDAWRIGVDGSRRNLTSEVDQPLVFWEPRVWFPGYERNKLSRSQILFQTAGEGDRAVVSLDLKTGVTSTIPVPDKGAVLKAVSASGRQAAFLTPEQNAKTLLAVDERSPSKPFVKINKHLKDVKPAKKVAVEYAFGEDTLTGCLFLPSGQRPDQGYPLIVNVYPSRATAGYCASDRQGLSSAESAELLAAQGYAVFLPHTPRHLMRIADGPLSGLTAVVKAGVDKLVAEGWADLDRLGLYGFSGGGTSVPFMLTQTDIFKAGIAISGKTDYASLYGDLPLPGSVLAEDWFHVGASLRFEGKDAEWYLGGAPWQVPDAYVRSSAYYHADKISTPLMLINSDMDHNSSIGQYGQLFVALHRQRKEASWVRYWGEGHWLNSPANVRDKWGRIFAWYGKYLGEGSSGKVTTAQPARAAEKDSE